MSSARSSEPVMSSRYPSQYPLQPKAVRLAPDVESVLLSPARSARSATLALSGSPTSVEAGGEPDST